MFDHADPIEAFIAVFARAATTAPPPPADHTAAALATADAAGRPSVRMVLVRHVDRAGFVFYTNYESRKARELEANPRAALCFFWHWLEEQVRVEGRVERTSAQQSDAYFATRPRGSQLAAWTSRQSTVLASRAELEAQYRAIEARFAEQPVPRPPFWGGFRIVPDEIEFWRAGADRLHDRLRYRRDGDGWRAERLYP
jgi:pyridoxamine 5'-phosphate oxidase